MKNDNHRAGRKWRRRLLAIAGVLCLAGEPAYANPTGPAVANGQVGFSTAGNVLTVTNSPGSIINWQSFSIGSNEVTRFLQQSSASSVLNRVSGINPSTILGALQSNGRVFLINPSGIMFGVNAQIDVAGLVASTLNLSDADFLAGRFRFTDMPGAAGIANQGSITTTAGGMVYLVAPDIQNSGIIKTPQGEILLAAGKSVELVDAQTPEVRVQISAPDNQVLNLGQLIAEGGRIGIYAGLIQHGGVANANTAVVGENGKIVFKATNDVTLDAGSQTTANGPQGGSVTVQSETGTTLVSGTVEAKGTDGKGGTVHILGNQVGLVDNASVNASGQTGGGTVLVGGDRHGDNPDIQNAWRTYFGSNASVKADAVASGDGGKVIVWSDDVTRYYGSISARGGMQEGDGGFAEVSGKDYLDYRGLTNLSATKGTVGTLLLDPDSVDITTTANSANMTAATPFASNDANPSTVTWATLDQALAGATVVVQTSSGDINIANSYNFAADNTASGGRNNSATGTLELLSAANITAASGQTVTGRTGLSLWLNAAGTTTLDTNLANFDDVNFQNGTTSTYSGILSGTGSLTKGGAGTLVLSGANSNSGGTTVSAGVLQGDTTSLQGNITDNASVVFDQAGPDIYAGVISGTGAVTKQNTGNVTFSGTNTYGGGTTISGGTLTLGHATDTLANSGAITINSGGTLALGGNSDTVGAVTLTSGLITGSAGVLTGTSYDVRDGSISAILAGTGVALNKTTSGTVTLSGANTYTGLTTVSNGTLNLNTTGANAIASNLTVSGGSAVLQQSDQIADTANVVVSGGTLDLATFNDTVNGVQLTSGNINGSGGTLSSVTAFDMRVGAVSAKLGGSVGLNKTTTGTVILSGANTYTGTTAVDAGTLVVGGDAPSGAAGALGNSTSAVTVGSAGNSASLLAGGAFTIGRDIAVQDTTGQTVSLGGNSAASSAFSGAVTLNQGATLTAVSGGTATFSGVLNDGAGSFAVTKSDTGTVVLSNTNTYSGGMNVTAGVLNLRASGAAGDAGTVLVTGGAAVELQGGITIARALTLNGTGTGGALRNISSNNTWSGAITLGSAARINSDAGTLTIATGGISGDTQPLTVGGAGDTTISAVIGTTSGTLTKDGAGVLTLSGANTYTGLTTVSNGTLNLNTTSSNAIAGNLTVSGGSAVLQQSNQIVDVANVVVSGGTLDMATFNDTVNGVQLTGGSITGSGGVLTGASYDVQAGSISAILGGSGALTKTTGGTVILSGANTYTGATNVNVGVLNLQNSTAAGTTAGGVVVANGAALELQGGVAVGAEVLTLDGTGVGGGGALRSISGNNSWAGAITDTTNPVRINSDTNTDTLTLTGGIANGGLLLTLGGAGNAMVSTTAISGTGGLTKDGSGTLTLSGTNLYTGVTTINAGTLKLAGGAAIADTGAVSLADVAGVTLDLNGTNETIGSLTSGGTIGGIVTNGAGATTSTLTTGDATNATFSGVIQDGAGTVALTKRGSGIFTLSGANTYTGTTTLNASTLKLAGGAAISDTGAVSLADVAGVTLDLNGTNETIGSLAGGGTTGGIVTNGAGPTTSTLTTGDATDTTFSGVIQNGAGTVALTKQGSGAFTLSGANTYNGTTTLNAGTLRAQTNAAALGAGALALNGGTLQLASNTATNFGRNTTVGGTVTIESDRVSAGVGVTHTLGTLSIGAQTITLDKDASVTSGTAGLTFGTTTLTGGATLNSNTGVLTTLGAVTGTGRALTVGGTGDTMLSGGLNTGAGGTLTKNSTGTLTLAAAGNFTGLTTVSAGTLIASANDALGTNATGTTVSSGATLGFANGVAYNTTETIVLNGTGATGRAGALDNISGANSFAGTLTLVGGGNSTIGATAGSFTHSGSTVGASDLTYNPATDTTITESGVVSGVGTNVIKNGAGTLTLSGANTYTGATNINDGVLSAQNANALGTTGTGTTVSNGGTLNINGVAIGAEALTLNSTGVGGNGALTSTGTALLGGNVNISTDSRIGGSGNLTLNGTVSGQSLDLSNTAGSVVFTNDVTLAGMTVAGNNFNVSFTGGSNSIGGTTTFSNTGTLTLGDQNTDSTTFVGGVVATAPASKSIAGTIAATTGGSAIDLGTTAVTVTDNTTVGGAATGPITLGNATIADGKSLTMGTGIGNVINLGSVLGNAGAGTEALTINTTGVANVAGAVGATGNALDQLTITQSGGTTFAGAVDAMNVTISDTAAGQTVAFQNAVTATSLGVGAGAYNISLTGTGDTITNAMTFNNTGTLTLGRAGGTQTYNGGITATAPSGTTLNGTISTSNDALTFGPVTIGADTTLNAGSAGVTFTSTVNGPAGLTVNSTGATTFNATAGGVTPLASLATDAGGTTSLQDVTTAGAQSYGDNVVLKSIYNTSNGAFSVGGTTAFSVASTAISTGSGDITFTGLIDGANNLTLTNTGITTFSSSVGGTTPLTTLTATAGNFVMPASVTTTSNITMTGTGSYSVPGVTTTSGGNIALTSTAGALSVNAASASAGSDITLTADEIELTGAANSITGSGNLRLQPQTVSQAIEIGGLGGTGALDITNIETTKIATGFPNITIGRTAGTGAVSFNTSSFNDHLTVIGGSIAANGALTAAGKTITLTANSGGISSSTGAGVNVVANALNANAVGNITLNTRVDTINAASSAGGITLVEADGATLANVSAPAGDVDITATTGNLALDTVTAGTTNNKFALLFAPNGTITDANGSAVNVTAANIELVARDGIDLDTKAFNSDFTTANFPALQPSRLNAGTITAVNTGIADIDIRQVGNADILNVATASDQTTSGNITISGTDSLAVNTVSAGGLVYFGTAPSITTKSVGGNMLITLNSPRASAGLSDPTVTLAGGGLVPVNDTGRDGGPGKVAMIERFVAPSGADDYRVTGTGTGDNRFTLVVAGQVPVVGGTIKITAPGAITDYTGMPPDTSEVINVLNLVGQTIEVSGFTSSLAYQLVTDGSGLEGFSPEQTLPASVAQLVQQIAASQRSTQDKEEKKKQEALAGRVCR